jgi:hypothetical protein
VTVSDAGVTTSFRNEAIYSRIHEYGGTTKPIRAKYLTIPMDTLKTKAGVARITARDLPRNQTFVAKSKKGNLFIWLNQIKNDPAPIPVFLLKESVTLEPKLKAWWIVKSMERRYAKAITESMDGFWGSI